MNLFSGLRAKLYLFFLSSTLLGIIFGNWVIAVLEPFFGVGTLLMTVLVFVVPASVVFYLYEKHMRVAGSRS